MLSQQDQEMRRNVPDPLFAAAAICAEVGLGTRLSTIQKNGVSAFQREIYTGRIGSIVGTLESDRIIKVSAFQGCPQGGVPL